LQVPETLGTPATPAPPALPLPPTVPSAWQPRTPSQQVPATVPDAWQPQTSSQAPRETTSKKAETSEVTATGGSGPGDSSSTGPSDITTTKVGASGIHAIIRGANETARHVQQKAREVQKKATDIWGVIVHYKDIVMNSTDVVWQVLAKVVNNSKPVLQALQRFGTFILNLTRRGINATAEGLAHAGALGVVDFGSNSSANHATTTVTAPTPTTKNPGVWMPQLPGDSQQPMFPATATTLPTVPPDTQTPWVVALPTRKPGPIPITTSLRGIQGPETKPSGQTGIQLPPEWNIW